MVNVNTLKNTFSTIVIGLFMQISEQNGQEIMYECLFKFKHVQGRTTTDYLITIHAEAKNPAGTKRVHFCAYRVTICR